MAWAEASLWRDDQPAAILGPQILEGMNMIRRSLIPLAAVVFLPGVLRADDAEDKAALTLYDRGGSITRDEKANGRPVVAVDLKGINLSDRWLKELAPFKQLRELYLSSNPVTDAGLKELAGLK